MKRSQPPKKGRTLGAEVRAEAASDSPQKAQKRCIYPREVTTTEAHMEFLESLSDLINLRLDEIKRAYKKDVSESGSGRRS